MRERPHSADGDGGMAGPCVNEDVALRIRSHAGYFAQIKAGGQLQRIGHGVEFDFGRRALCADGTDRKHSGDDYRGWDV